MLICFAAGIAAGDLGELKKYCILQKSGKATLMKTILLQ
jgi:hypothetical protein